MVLGYTVWSWNHLEPLMKPEAWDLEAFARINQFTAPGWLDKGAVLFRTASTWIPLYLLVLIWLLRIVKWVLFLLLYELLRNETSKLHSNYFLKMECLL